MNTRQLCMKIPKICNKINGCSIIFSHIWHIDTSKCVYCLKTHSSKVCWSYVLPNRQTDTYFYLTRALWSIWGLDLFFRSSRNRENIGLLKSILKLNNNLMTRLIMDLDVLRFSLPGLKIWTLGVALLNKSDDP